MKKTLVTVLIVVAVVLALGVAGALGYVWYRNNHVVVEGDAFDIAAESLDLTGEDISVAYYEELQSKLPDCKIQWMVPFQTGKYGNDTEKLTVSELSVEDVEFLVKYFPKLKTLDASQCDQYDVLEVAEATLSGCEVIYSVDLDALTVDHNTETLETGFPESGDFKKLMANLKYLPKLQSLKLTDPALTLEQTAMLRAAYPEITIAHTVKILGMEYEADITELDLSGMTPGDAVLAAEQIKKLPLLSYVNLTPENGIGALSLTDVKNLMDAVPEVVFGFTFDFYGHTLSTADEEVHIKNTKIGNEGEQTVRDALSLMKNCKRFVLENCQISNEVMAKIRDDYRHQTKVVWRVSYGIGSTLTDAEVIRAVYDLVDDNCYNLIYCEDARYMDIGHNEWLDGCDFVAGMKSLEYVIISGAPIKSLEPFRNCKNLKLLEAAFCEYITDVSPLADCPNLQMLNISNTHVTDLTPLDNLPLTHLTVRTNPSGRCRLSQEEQDRVIAQHPDCWISFSGAQPYGVGWRYGEDELKPLDHYKVIRVVFRLALDPNIPNHVGWYLKDEERAEIAQLEEAMDTALAAVKKNPITEPSVEETVPEETAPEETTP